MDSAHAPSAWYREERRFAPFPARLTRTVLVLALALPAGGSLHASDSSDLPETMTENIVMDYIRSRGISSVESLIQALPPAHKRNFVSLFRSSSPSRDTVSVEFPRVVSGGLDARFIASWGTNPEAPGFHHFEFLQHDPGRRRWIAGVIDFSGGQPVLRHPNTCARCHSELNRPLWGGTEWLGSERRAWDDRIEPGSDEEALHDAMLRSTNPRLTPLELSAYAERPRHVRQGSGSSNSDPAGELGTLQTMRHAETLFGILRDTLSDKEIASYLCHVPPNFSDGTSSFHAENAIRALFDQKHYNIGRMADTLELFSATTREPRSDPHEHNTTSTSLSRSIVFLALHGLWARHPRIAEIFQQTSNEDAIEGIVEHQEHLLLKYPKGEATAEDELVAGYNDFFMLHGQASMNERQKRGGPLYYSSSFAGHFAQAFVPKVCSVIDRLGDGAFANENTDVDTGGGGGGGGSGSPSPAPPPAPPAPDPEPEPAALTGLLAVPAKIETGIPVRFDGSGSVGAESYRFDFGDGAVIAHPNPESRPSHTYVEPGSYGIRLEVASGDCGSAYCRYSTATATVEVRPGPLPAARFEIDADCSDDLCIVSTDVGVALRDLSLGTVAQASWDFGDGETSSARDPRHSWSSPGFYRVVLTASGLNATSTAGRDILVRSSDPAGACEPDSLTLCLGDSRYQVRSDWWTADGRSGPATVVHAGTNDSGLFWFFGRENWELLIKVLDGCVLNGNAWVFAASSTNVGFRIRVTDTVTGAENEYRNQPGEPAPTTTDEEAFPGSCRD